MAITRVDTSIGLSDTGLPIVASNPLSAPILLSAVIPNGTNQVVATFNAPCSDDGGALGSYTGDARLYDCANQVQLTIGVGTQAGDGTVTYNVQEILIVGAVYQFTAAGVLTTCEPQVAQRFVLNGTGEIVTGYTIPGTTEGAMSCSFNSISNGTAQDIMGDDATYIRLRDVDDLFRVQVMFGTATTTALAVVRGVDTDAELKWNGDGTLTVDASVEGGIPKGVIQASVAFRIGNGPSSLFFVGAIWDVKVYSDEAMTAMVHWWKMDEGAGATQFLDSQGTDHITIDYGVGAWV